MQRKKSTAQRSLLVDWPTWYQLPTEVRQHVEHLVVSMCLEVIQSHNSQEQFDARSHDKDSSS